MITYGGIDSNKLQRAFFLHRKVAKNNKNNIDHQIEVELSIFYKGQEVRLRRADFQLWR